MVNPSTAALLSEIADLLEGPRPLWHRSASCRGLGPERFFPPSFSTGAAARGIEVCAGCPVQEQCAEAGEREHHGVWGGRLRVQRPGRQVAWRSTAILGEMTAI